MSEPSQFSDLPRITDAGSSADPVARDLIQAARVDAAPEGARERARARLEVTLSAEGMTTHVTALSEAAAAQRLAMPLLAPVALPPSREASSSSRRAGRDRMLLYSAIAAVAILGVSGGVVVSVRGRSHAPSPQQTSSTAAPAPATMNAPAAEPGTPRARAAPAGTGPASTLDSAPGGTTVATNREDRAGSDIGPRDHSRGGNIGARSTHGSSAGATPSASSRASNAPAANAGGTHTGTGCAARCRGNMDCLLRCSTGGGSVLPTAGSSANVREAPSRQDVISAMNGVRRAVQACGNGRSGTASVTVTFGGSGRVTAAEVAPPFAGTVAGSCIAHAVRGARVPPFARPTFRVTYPFVIR